MAQTVKITPSLGKLEFIGDISLAASTSAIFTGNSAGSISLIFPASQGISITGSLTVTGSAKFSSILDSANATGTLNYVIAANGSGGYTWTDVTTILNASYVPLSRTITIDGVSQDLSTNRTWNILPTAGLAGQILAKNSDTNYDVTWIDNYTSTVKHLVKLGETMTAGTPVYVSGTTGQSGTNMIVSKATNGSEMGSSKTIGLVATGGNTNDIVFVITEGLLEGLNTSTAAAGDPVWLGPNGTLIYGLANKPSAPAHLVFIGIVTRVQQNNGEIFIKVQNGFELEELHNVSISSPSTGQLLRRDSDGLWKNWTPNYLTAEVDTLDSVLARGNTTQYAIIINNSTESTSPGTGALVVAGGAGFGGNVYIDGDLVVGGTTTTVSAQNLKVADNMIYLNDGIDAVIIQASGNGSQIVYTTQAPHGYTPGMDVTVSGLSPEDFNVANAEIIEVSQDTFTVAGSANGEVLMEGSAVAKSESNPDIGLSAGYYDTAYKHGGFFRDASDGTWKVYEGYELEPDASPFIDTAHPSFTYAPLRAAQITADSFVKVGGTSSQFLKADGSVDSTTYLTTENDPYRVTSVSVSGTATKTITITRANSTTVSTTWTDYDTDTNTYVTSAGFNTGTGVLTLTRNDAGTVTVDLDGRYSEIGHTHSVSTGTGGYIEVAGGTANVFSIDSRDRRALVDLPSTFDRGLYLDFKNPQIFPELSAGGYKGQMIWRAYGDGGDMSGGFPMQIVYDQEGNIHYRLGISGNAWEDVFSTVASQQWVVGQGYLTGESDPTVPSHVKSITTTNISNWNAAYNDKINSASFNTGSGVLTLTQQDGGTVTINLDGRYLTTETDSQTLDWIPETQTLQISNGNQVQLTGLATEVFVASQGYLTTESDPTVPSHVKSITTTNISNWNTAYNDKINSAAFNTGNGILTLTQQDGGTVTVNLDGRYLTSETDSQTLNWIPETLTLQISNGNQVELIGLATEIFVTSQGYLTSYTETDPTVPSHVKSITTTNISNWNTAYNDKINSASFNTGNGVLTLTQQDGGTVTVNLDGRYLTSASDSQTLNWIPETLTLQISNGNQVELIGLATETFVTSQGYITGYSETDTLASVTSRGASTSTSIQVNAKIGTSDNQGIFLRGISDVTHKIYYNSSTIANIWEYNANILFQHYNVGTPITRFTFSTNGDGTASGSFRAPIFYDSNDTSYYLDPNSGSNLHTVTILNTYVDNAIYFGGGNNYLNWDGARIASNVGIQSSSDMRAPVFYDSANTNYYLDPNGTSILSSATFDSGISDNNSSRIFMPGGASSVNNQPVTSGAIRINLPVAAFGVNTMMSMTVHVYEYSSGQSFTIRLGGYNYFTHEWYNTFAYMINDTGKQLDIPVFFGNDGTRDVIWLGQRNWGWEYPNVFVTDFQTGHSQYSAWRSGWSITFDQLDPTNVTQQRTAHRQIDTGNIGSQSVSYSTSSGNSATTSQTNFSALSVNSNAVWHAGNFTNNSTNWNAAYNDKINSASFNTSNGVLTLTQQDGGTVTVNLDGRYLTSASDSQTLDWIPETLTLQISNGNQVELTGLATETWVASQGYITGYSETDTLATVTARGATTSNTIQVGKLGIGRAASSNESISVENPEGTWLIQGFRNGTSIGGLHTNSGILHVQAQGSAEIRLQTSGNATWNGNILATRTWVGSQGYLTAEADTLASVTARGASTSEAVNFSSTQLTMSPHYYTNMYSETETYVHFYPAGGNGPQISAVNWRLWNGENGAMVLRAAGDGSLTWDGNEIATRVWVQAQGYLTSVSDVWVNTTGDTMTGALTINTTGTANAAAFRIVNTSSSTFIHSQENFAPNLTSGQHNILAVGKSGSTKNAGYVGYYWAGDASNSNFVTLGHWGSDDLVRIYGDGSTSIYGNTTLLNGGQLFINNSSPTIYLQDSDHRSGMIHMNSNNFYILNGSGTNSQTWTQQINGRWALQINLADNYTTFGGIGDFPTEVYAGGSFRAPIFYDSADTNYYLDANSQSVLYNVKVDNVLRIGPNYHVQQNANGDLEFKYI